jgi:hypothetical protein
MKLSPKARRFVTEATGHLNTGERDRLLAWLDRFGEQELPSAIAQLALRALERFEREMTRQLKTGDLDENQKADAMNDIAFIRSVMSDLRQKKSRAA